jgi:exodeoxyribonuclease VII large subunit
MQTTADESQARVITVTELNRLAKEVVERGLPLLWVAGEVSNFMRATSGHCYFSLKDAQAQVRCVLFRHKLQLHDWQPQNGMQIEVRAYPSVYEQRGEFQLNVETMRRSGLGALYEAFEKLKAKLQAEGLFDAALKRPLPRFPRTVGIVTSLKAAALRDVLTTLRRRMPGVVIIIYPTAVQGDGAAQQIAQAIVTADARAAVDKCDVLIVCRGGGSIEDLWAFNDEMVARAIRACAVPVVSGVGHETDFTIADFAADARAPTPTAAAEMASPNRADLYQELRHLRERLIRVTERGLERRMQQLDVLVRRLVHPGERIANQLTHLSHLASRLRGGWSFAADSWRWGLREIYRQLAARRPDVGLLAAEQRALAQRLAGAARGRVETMRAEVKSLTAQLAHLNPQAVLERGYSITETTDGAVVRDSAQVKPDEPLKITFSKGWARTKVLSKNE